jgi:polyferredoxin
MARTIQLPQLEATRATDDGPFLRPEGRVLATLEEDGRRRWLRPKPSPGRWWRRRLAVAWMLILVFAAVPWTTYDGLPTVLLDIVERKFVFFGAVFRPTESLLFGLGFLAVFVGIFLLTAIFGRVWCGWACPQTVYLEFVYRPLERLFLGKGYANPKAEVAPWRRVAMYAAFIVVSAHLANTFLAWFVGADRLTSWIFTSTPFQHPVAFAVFAATTLLMLFDFAFFREQLCSLVCPYGRFQSALLDRDSLVVGYDRLRGEPRGRASARRQSADCGGGCGCDGKGGCGSGGGCDGKGHAHEEPQPARGDCIDCTLCVQTCPAGIDIRDGLQLECIHCTQCIDACDAVMTKLGRPTGLIRYSSHRALERAPRAGRRMRIVVYPLLLAVLVAGIAVLLMRRTDAFVAVLPTQGIPYAIRDEGGADERVESIVRLRIDNRTRGARVYAVAGGDGVALVREERIEVAGDGSGEIDVVVRSAKADFARGRRDVTLVVRELGERDGAFAGEVETHVLGPLVLAPVEGGGR